MYFNLHRKRIEQHDFGLILFPSRRLITQNDINPVPFDKPPIEFFSLRC